MMNEYPGFKVGYDSILFDSGQLVKFDLPVSKAVACGGNAIVLLEIPSGSILNENVLGVSPDGQILWQVSPRTYVYDDSPYTDVQCQGTRVKLVNWDGVNLILDPVTGNEITRQEGR